MVDDSLLKLVVVLGCEGLPYILFLSPLTVFLPALQGRLGNKKGGGGLASKEQNANSAYGATHHASPVVVVGGGGGAKAVDMPPLAFTSQLLQCALWTMYGFGAGKVVCVIPNIGGTLLGLLYCGLYSRLGDRRTYGRHFRAQMAATVACLSFSLVAYEALWLAATLTGPHRFETMADVLSGFVTGISYVAAAVNTLLLGHPTAVLLQVWETGRASLMGSAFMNVVSLLCSLCWAVNAALFLAPPDRPNAVDWAIFVPNVIGVAVGGAALVTRLVLSLLLATAPTEPPPAKPPSPSSVATGGSSGVGIGGSGGGSGRDALMLLELGEHRRSCEGGRGSSSLPFVDAATIRYNYHHIQDLQVS